MPSSKAQKKKEGRNGDTYQRINFLHQAAHFVSINGDQTLAREYGKQLKRIANGSVLRLESDVKSTLCKNCNSVLIPGLSATVKLKSKREQHLIKTCLHCGAIKRRNTKLKLQKKTKIADVETLSLNDQMETE
eukprot:TRINITY_DN5113_c0_g1_i1.p1 TRINITY_DN5113_c0_g1~~TRINITY_DN5113_c0_g1_i1.p1  ORF type:complete len:133 (-),score=13.11 TRINITY_DN5113_c0_g1_i1:119-517(-)